MISDFTKYNRVFAFGCSFTSYIYPTWADVLSKEMPNADFYNIGQRGAGNKFIALKISEANNKFKFNESDLILNMYTTVCREDRFINQTWRTVGNVFRNKMYDENFVKKYADVDGYYIESLGLIDLSIKYLKSLPCTSIFLLGCPLNNNYEITLNNTTIADRLNELYTEIYNLPTPYTKFLEENGSTGYSYLDQNNQLRNDGHPMPYYAFLYLKYLGFPLTEKSYNFAIEENQRMEKINSIQEVERYYYEILNLTHARDMF